MITSPIIFKSVLKDVAIKNQIKYVAITSKGMDCVIFFMELESKWSFAFANKSFKNAIKWRIEARKSSYPSMKTVEMTKICYYDAIYQIQRLIGKFERIGGVFLEGNLLCIYKELSIAFPNKGNVGYSCQFNAREIVCTEYRGETPLCSDH